MNKRDRLPGCVRLALAALLAAMPTPPAAAAEPVDCPLRDMPFSAATPLVDVMLSEPAKAVLEREMPDLLKGVPEEMLRTTAPTFGAILDLRSVASIKKIPAEKLAVLEAALAGLPVTDADRAARCARYDVEVPKLAAPHGKLRILLFDKMTGFRDGPSVDAANAAFLDMAKRNGWGVVRTDKGGAFTPATLAKFDLIIWNNVSGDVLTLGQRAAFKAYIEDGGGYLGIHGSAGDPVTYWDWYVDELVGARFLGHPMAKHFQTARVDLEDAAHPVAKGLPASWEMNEEWYSFKTNPRATGSRIIATLDETSYEPVGLFGLNLEMGDHPVIWSRCVGRGRSFYSAIGHRPELYSDRLYMSLLERAILWSAGKNSGQCNN